MSEFSLQRKRGISGECMTSESFERVLSFSRSTCMRVEMKSHCPRPLASAIMIDGHGHFDWPQLVSRIKCCMDCLCLCRHILPIMSSSPSAPTNPLPTPTPMSASAASSVPQYSFGLFDPNTIPQSTPLAANRALSALLTFPPPGGPLDDRLDAERAGLESEDDPQVHDDEHPADEDDDSPAAFLRRQQRAKATEAASIDPFLDASGHTTPSAEVTSPGGLPVTSSTTGGQKRQRADNFDDNDEEPQGIRKKRYQDMSNLIKNSIPLTSQSQALLDMYAGVSCLYSQCIVIDC